MFEFLCLLGRTAQTVFNNYIRETNSVQQNTSTITKVEITNGVALYFFKTFTEYRTTFRAIQQKQNNNNPLAATNITTATSSINNNYETKAKWCNDVKIHKNFSK